MRTFTKLYIFCLSVASLCGQNFIPANLPNWTVNQPYSATIQGFGVSGNYQYNLVSGATPTGLNIDQKLACPALISGPYFSGSYLKISSGLTGGAGPRQFTIVSGSLPNGVTLSQNGTLSGSATQTGTFNYRLAATESGSGVYRDCSLVVSSPGSFGNSQLGCALDSANVSSFYSSSIQMHGTQVPVSFQIVGGGLPSGLSLSSSTGEITGTPSGSPGLSSYTVRVQYPSTSIDRACSIRTFPNSITINNSSLRGVPTVPGTYTFTIGLTTELVSQITTQYSVIINPAPSLSANFPTLPTGNVGASYTFSGIPAAVTGGTSPYTFDVSTGSLPPGISLSSTGILSGSPSVSGSYNFTVRVVDAAGATASVATSIQVTNTNNVLQIITSSLPIGILNEAYPSTTVVASGGSGPYNFSFYSINNPPGLAISSDGVITGTPIQPGTYPVEIGVSNPNTESFTSKPLPILITSFYCPTSFAYIGQSYSSPISLSPFAPVSYAISSGRLPTNFVLNGSSGLINGSPGIPESTSFTVTVTDASGRQLSRSCSITTQSELQLTSSRTTARFGVPYNSFVGTQGGTGSNYTHSIVSGSLPSGLTLNSSTGRISGVPNVIGPTTYRVRTQNGNSLVSEEEFTTYSLGRDYDPILRCPLPSVGFGRLYSSGLSLNAPGSALYAIQGSLPPGFFFDSSTGHISGTSTSSGSYSFGATATIGSTVVEASCQISVAEISTPQLNVACPDQSDLVLGEFYASPAIASGGVKPYTYSLYQSSLPSGLTLNSSTGLVSGTMTAFPPYYATFGESIAGQQNQATQSFYYLIRVADGNGNIAYTDPYCGSTVSDTPPLSILTSSIAGATVGGNYSTDVQFAGGVAPYTFSIVDPLPANMLVTLVGNSIRIAGTFFQPGSIPLRVIVRDSAKQTAYKDYLLFVGTTDPLRISSRVLNGGTVGINYSEAIGAEGGSPPYRFALASGVLPTGTTLGSDGTFRGVPTTAGTYNFEAEVTDSAGGRASARFALSIFQGNFRLGCPNLQAEIGVPYNSPANVLGGSQPYSFSISSGQLPAGLSLDNLTGTISGRPTQAGAFIFTFGVSDARQARTQTQCSIGVLNGALRITTEAITSKAAMNYQGQLEAAGGSGPYVWTLLNAASEAGLTVAANGSFSGKGTKKGIFAANVRAADAAGATTTKAISVVITDSDLSLACPTETRFQLGVAAAGRFLLTGGQAPYRLSVVSGLLPPGLELGMNGQFTMRGAQTGTFTPQLQAVDDTNTAVTARCTFEVSGEPFVITTDSLPEGAVGAAYSASISSSGGFGRVRYGLSSGSLPAGLEFDSSTGSISGTPEVEGVFSVGAGGTDELQRRASRVLNLRIAAGTVPFRITTGSPLADGLVGRAYSNGFSAEGGKPPYQFTISGLPEGLESSGEAISGTPAQAGDATISVTARDAAGASVAKSFLLRIKSSGLIIITESLPDGVLGQTYGAGIARQGGAAPFTWSILSGAIPTGVTFNSATGNFEGIPNANGAFQMTVEVSDAAGATSRKSYTFEIRPPGVDRLSITTASLPEGNAGVSYSASLGATGGRPPYAWTLSGDLPAGLSMTQDGTISGSPQVVGTQSFLATVTDSLGLKASRVLSLKISTTSVPALAIEGLPDATTGNQNIGFTLRMASAFGLAVSGRLTLTFVPDSIHGADDPSVRFANTTRSFSFIIPAGSTSVNLTGGAATISTGTLAGTIRVDSVLDFAGTSAPGPTRSIQVRRAVPVITTLTLTRNSGGIEVRIQGFTNTRQLSEARVTFSTAADVDLTTASQVTVNVASAIQAWFASAASQPFGGQFSLTLPFTVSGNSASIASVSVVITNSEGASTAATAN